jgi:hypothetical protein
MLIDSPVMVGHRRDSLPLARNFKAIKVEVDGRTWIKSYFYWMKDSEGAEDLKNNIDGGIYKECSVSFLFSLPECSICGKDIRNCRHLPFSEYEVKPGRTEIAHFNYRNIEKVLETSLVFRGSIPDTKITNKLTTEGETSALRGEVIEKLYFSKGTGKASLNGNGSSYGRAKIAFGMIDSFEIKESESMLYALPYQPGLMFRAIKIDDKIELVSSRLFPTDIHRYLIEILSKIKAGSFIADILLYATRGKERLNGFGLAKVIKKGVDLHRLKLKLCDIVELDGVRCAEHFAGRLEHINDLLHNVECASIEALRVLKLEHSEWEQISVQDGRDKYKYGLELLIERRNGHLIRHLLSKKKITPATVERIDVNSRANIRCDFRPIGRKLIIDRVVCPKAIGMDKGAIVLLAVDTSASDEYSSKTAPVDIMPGTESTELLANGTNESRIGKYLHLCDDDDNLLMQFYQSGTWKRFRVYHFSSHLLQQGRRFVADLLEDGKKPGKKPVMQKIALNSISGHGKLFIIKPTDKTDLFGEVCKLYLRPVFIDGDERFLFYSDRVIDHQ